MNMHRICRKVSDSLEWIFYIEASQPLSEGDLSKLVWLVGETFEPGKTGFKTFLNYPGSIDIGPRRAIETPFSSNALSICKAIDIPNVTRVEQIKRRYPDKSLGRDEFLKMHLDRMTEEVYPSNFNSFATGIVPEPVKVVDLMGRGIDALRECNDALGLGMDSPDMEYYLDLFVNQLQRNPTDVELLQLGNANSDHSRHWLFKGQIIIDGIPMERTLLQVVQAPLQRLANQTATLKAFNDNSGVLRGFEVNMLVPFIPGTSSSFELRPCFIHITATAETHNHPTGVEAFAGAQTGAGGRIRDNVAVGRGGILGVGVAGYFVGNLFIPGFNISGENVGKDKPSKYASPLEILIRGSDGISSYGNEIGEPLTLGFCRTFGQMVGDEWREARKPILYSGGIGHVDDRHLQKEAPQIGMHIVAIGGPAYPIGVGGGSASSMISGQNTEDLDFNSVQRGNAEMENRANRVIRTCMEMGDTNPISSIQDQGAGGSSNVLTELLEPLGGKINIRGITLGDETMSVREIWSAEFQERYGLLIRPDRLRVFQQICERERVNCEVLGCIDGSGKIVVEDPTTGETPVDLNLEQILTNLPQKTYVSERKKDRGLKPLSIPEDLGIEEAIDMVFGLPQVGSKGHLVHKVDRSVTGCVVRQQCCGMAQIPIADNSVNVPSLFATSGSVGALGEQPNLMLINPVAGARMAVAEMITNMVSVRVTDVGDIRCRANWMWPAKLPYECADLYDAAVSMSDFMIGFGIAIEGGKDSSALAAKVCGEMVKTPGCLVILGFAPVPDITKVITPDIKKPGNSFLALIDLGLGKNRLGGSSFAQALNQLGDECPDIDPVLLKRAFLAVQKMIDEEAVLAVHDRSGGGFITSVAEMCMASGCGFNVDVFNESMWQSELFNEEAGWVLEVDRTTSAPTRVVEICREFDIPVAFVGITRRDFACMISGRSCLWKRTISEVRTKWERTSNKLQELQKNPQCALEEAKGQGARLPSIDSHPAYRLTFDPESSPNIILKSPPRVAILREEGTNGDREMTAAFYMAGFAPIDVLMNDLLSEKDDEWDNFDSFRGIVFPGGFSFKDVFGSAKGWAGTILFNERLSKMFDDFRSREDTFSFGPCNGCQFMSLLGWVPWKGIQSSKQPRFVQNESGRFESRWSQVEILPSPAMMLEGMEGSRLGIWTAHGEGRMVCPDSEIEQRVKVEGLAPIVYINPYGDPTDEYPYNPNGSPGGVTALCSADGRHLAMMPHPERCFLKWQQPWMPSDWKDLKSSPWMRMFQNARSWCDGK